MPIDQTDSRLKEWVEANLGDVDVSFDIPGGVLDAGADARIHLYLMQIEPQFPLRGARPNVQEVKLHYLVTAGAGKIQDAHRLLGELLFAALDTPDFEVIYEAVPMGTWTALGVPPQPAFVLKVPLYREKPELIAKPVRTVVVDATTVTTLSGIVLGPEDQPIYGARVEVPAYRLRQMSDEDGRFHFSAVPAQPIKKVLRIRARGREWTVNVEHTADNQPLVIRFNPFE
jgi:hypothetical protein